MPPTDFAERLQSQAAILLDRTASPGALRAACECLFQDFGNRCDTLDETPSALGSGKALSAREAALCLLDYRRTTVLLRAIDSAIGQQPHRPGPICVLYAGCGPFASLILPLLARYPAEHLRVCLLDVHAHSLRTAEALCHAAGVADRLLPSLCGDAAQLRLPPALRVDLLIAEVMQRALAREPQFAVLANLVPQCPAELQVLPARIRVSAALADLTREFDPQATRLRIELGELMELSQRRLPGLIAQVVDGRIRCPDVGIPEHTPEGLSLILRTRIEASDTDVLCDYDSGLSYPLMLQALGVMRSGARFQCHYRLGSDPGFELEPVARTSPASA